jgi:hypothetical protein
VRRAARRSYSSAAPLSADARQRIVCEARARRPAARAATGGLRADASRTAVRAPPPPSFLLQPQLANFKGPLTLSVTVGPPPPVLELVGASESWTPRQVVGALLADRSTGRVSTGQRVSLAALEEVRSVERDGGSYIYYEARSRGGPSAVDPRAATFRRAAGVVARRGDYYYSLSLSAPERLWPELAPAYAAALDSFRLDAPGPAFRDPDTPALQLW